MTCASAAGWKKILDCIKPGMEGPVLEAMGVPSWNHSVLKAYANGRTLPDAEKLKAVHDLLKAHVGSMRGRIVLLDAIQGAINIIEDKV